MGSMSSTDVGSVSTVVELFQRLPASEQDRLLDKWLARVRAANVRHGTATPAPLAHPPALRIVARDGRAA